MAVRGKNNPHHSPDSTRRHLLMVSMSTVAGMAAGFPLASLAASLSSKSSKLASFDQIDLDLVGDVLIRQGAESKIVVRAEAHVLKKIRFDISGPKLSVFSVGSFQTQQAIEIEITTPNISQIAHHGAGDLTLNAMRGRQLRMLSTGSGEITLSDLNLSSLESDISGSSDMIISGKVGHQTILIDGAGNYDAAELQSDSAKVRVDGSADVVIAASRQLHVEIDGAGNVEYLGNPSVTQLILGAGELSQR